LVVITPAARLFGELGPAALQFGDESFTHCVGHVAVDPADAGTSGLTLARSPLSGLPIADFPLEIGQFRQVMASW
jgi:hypothetical protein